MTELGQFVIDRVQRGECRCGKCIDAGNPDDQPQGHTVDMYFFDVAAEEVDAERLRILIGSHAGEFRALKLLDGREHSYIDVGAWLGDQGMALMLMGAIELAGLGKVTTPKVLGSVVPKELMDQMARQGMVTVQATEPTGEANAAE